MYVGCRARCARVRSRMHRPLVALLLLAAAAAPLAAQHCLAMGMDQDLTRATQIAVQNAIDFVAVYRGWSQMEAYRLVSVACDVRVTELVDGNVGVHVMIPKS